MSDTDLRVLYLIDSLHQGGAERSLVDLAPHLVAAGVDLEIAVLKAGGMLEEEARRSGASLIHLTDLGMRRERLRTVSALIGDQRPTLVHTTLFESDVIGRPAAARHRVPVVSSIVNLAYGREHHAAPGLRAHRVLMAHATDAATARLVRRFHTNSAALVRPMSRRLGVPAARFDVVPRGRDPDLLGTRTDERRSRVRKALCLDDDRPVLLAAARHEHQKGLDVLINAAQLLRRQIPGLVVIIAGREGSRTPALVELVRSERLDDVVRFVGARSDVADLMVASDIFVLPSRWEGLPGTIIEAMALETPVVASDLPGVREVLGPLAGEAVVPADQPRDLADKLLATLRDRDSTHPSVIAGRARFLHEYTTGRVAQQMVAFYQRALADE